MIETLVVTRHASLVQYLIEIGLIDTEAKVLEQAKPVDVAGRHVFGVLPHALSCLTERFTEVPLNLPRELRGVELTIQQIRMYAGKPVTYEVRLADVFKPFGHACGGNIGELNGNDHNCCGNCRA